HARRRARGRSGPAGADGHRRPVQRQRPTPQGEGGVVQQGTQGRSHAGGRRRGGCVLPMRIKDMLFDRAAVTSRVDAAKRRVLSKAGVFIRTAARTSIRKRKGSAPPGKPPHSHGGSLRRLILFGYDRANDSVVVGPVGFKDSVAPRALEHGGTTVVLS